MVFLTKLREEKLMERRRLESRRGRGHGPISRQEISQW